MARIVKNENGKLTVELDFELEGSLLEMEEHIYEVLKKAGQTVTKEAIEKQDTDGAPIIHDEKRHTSKGREKKK
jgi:hypothetical protein